MESVVRSNCGSRSKVLCCRPGNLPLLPLLPLLLLLLLGRCISVCGVWRSCRNRYTKIQSVAAAKYRMLLGSAMLSSARQCNAMQCRARQGKARRDWEQSPSLRKERRVLSAPVSLSSTCDVHALPRRQGLSRARESAVRSGGSSGGDWMNIHVEGTLGRHRCAHHLSPPSRVTSPPAC
jgi:hypothetical protein